MSLECQPDLVDKDSIDIPHINVVPFANGFTWFYAGFGVLKVYPVAWIIASLVAVLVNGACLTIPIVGPCLSFLIFPVLLGGLILGSHRQIEGQQFGGFSFLNGPGASANILQLS
ncbi:MAG: hypothetical protein ACI9FB_002219 [Candidatus Azotimanducaceae bacterium]